MEEGTLLEFLEFFAVQESSRLQLHLVRLLILGLEDGLGAGGVFSIGGKRIGDSEVVLQLN